MNNNSRQGSCCYWEIRNSLFWFLVLQIKEFEMGSDGNYRIILLQVDKGTRLEN